MSAKKTPIVDIGEPDRKGYDPEESDVPEPRQSVIELLRRRAERNLGSRREKAEDAFALMQAETIDIRTKTPEEVLMAKQALKRRGDIRIN